MNKKCFFSLLRRGEGGTGMQESYSPNSRQEVWLKKDGLHWDAVIPACTVGRTPPSQRLTDKRQLIVYIPGAGIDA